MSTEHAIDRPDSPLSARQAEAVQDRRAQRRWPCNWPATYSIDRATFVDVRITDASIGGFGFSVVLPAEIDDTIVIIAEQIGTFTCRVAWKDDAASGVQILDNIDSLTGSQIDGLADALLAAGDGEADALA